MSRGVCIAHRSGARKWYPVVGNVLIESRMTWDLGYIWPRKYLTRSNESEAVRNVSLNDVCRNSTVYPSFQPNVERAIKSCDKFRSEQAIVDTWWGKKLDLGARSVLKWVGRLDRRNRPRVDFILHYARRMNDDRVNKKNRWLTSHNWGIDIQLPAILACAWYRVIGRSDTNIMEYIKLIVLRKKINTYSSILINTLN